VNEVHRSHCAIHNEPAMPAGACNCGALDRARAGAVEAVAALVPLGREGLMEDTLRRVEHWLDVPAGPGRDMLLAEMAAAVRATLRWLRDYPAGAATIPHGPPPAARPEGDARLDRLADAMTHQARGGDITVNWFDLEHALRLARAAPRAAARGEG
jgi:hypothetical protein